MLPPADMSGLMADVDIVLSLHRSEGFGLVPAEAMQLGKPVVATGWSGNMDFMNERNSAPVSYRLVPVQDPYDGAFVVRRPALGRGQRRQRRRMAAPSRRRSRRCAGTLAKPPAPISPGSFRPRSIARTGCDACRS